ncbi:MAG TPA: phosphoribosylaminoimidazolesuccinocarboxamide synthase [Patescibacteria group bacterium]
MSETNYKGLGKMHRGKVRDIYTKDKQLLIIATDRLSTFDVVMPDAIPGKGKVLTQISQFWFDMLEDKNIVENHLADNEGDALARIYNLYPELIGRTMLVKKARPLLVECVVRGYLSGSGWKEYKATGSVCGISLPKGLKESDRLPKPIFTPSTKAEKGLHDENITFDRAAEILGDALAEQVRKVSLKIYSCARKFAETKGIIIADTKFEFGMLGGQLILIDEVLTPDSSRFWPVVKYQPGRPQESYDKQFVRDYLEGIKWNKEPPAPRLPEKVIQKTAQKYREALQILTGKDLQ